MDEKTKSTLLDGAQSILNEVRKRTNAMSKGPEALVFEQITDVVISLVDAVFGEDEKPTESKKAVRPKVGDVLTTQLQLDRCPDKTVVLDNDHDAWQYDAAEDEWGCTHPDATPVDSNRLTDYYKPLTVVWLPEEK